MRKLCVMALLLVFSSCVIAAQTIMPASELSKLNTGELSKFNTKDCEGSFGLDVDVYYPRCMKFEKGGFQAHTVGKASYQWNDYEMYIQIMTSIFNPGIDTVKGFKQGIESIKGKADFEDFVPDGATLLDCGVVNIRDIKVPWFEYEAVASRMGESSWGVYRTYMIPADSGYLMNLQFSVGCNTGKNPIKDFRALAPMMSRCAVALTLKDYSQFCKGKGRLVSNNAASKAPGAARRTLLPEDIVKGLNQSKLRYFNLSKVKGLGCEELEATLAFPADLSFEVIRTGQDMALKGFKAWREHGLFLLMSVTVSDVGDAYLKDLKAALKEMTRKELASGFQKNIGATFMDGGVIDTRDLLYSWIDSSSVGTDGSNCTRMLTIPASDGKFLTVSYVVGTTGKNAPTADFKALKPLMERCQSVLSLGKK